jgi:hypothetical protein
MRCGKSIKEYKVDPMNAKTIVANMVWIERVPYKLPYHMDRGKNESERAARARRVPKCVYANTDLDIRWAFSFQSHEVSPESCMRTKVCMYLTY